MTSALTVNIRFVRCPKCWNVLEESPDIPVYACGGCGTHLKAKFGKNNAVSTNSTSNEQNDVHTSEPGRALEDNAFGSSAQEEILQSSQECLSEQNSSGDNVHSEHCNGEQLSHLTLEDEIHGRNDQNESEGTHVEQPRGVDISHDDNTGQTDEIVNDDSENKEHLRDATLSGKDQNCCNDQHHSSVCNSESPRDLSEAGLLTTSATPENGVLLPLAREKSDAELNEETAGLGGANTVVEYMSELDEEISRSDADNVISSEKGSRSIETSSRPMVETISSEVHKATAAEQLEKSPEIVHRGLDHVESFETVDPIDPSSEISGTLIDLSKSATTRSARVYYEGGLSSSEGVDEQLPSRYKRFVGHTSKNQDHVYSDERCRNGSMLVNRNPGVRHQQNSHGKAATQGKHYSMESSNLRQDELQESTRFHHPNRNWRRFERDEDEHQLSGPFNYGDGYGNGSTSYSTHNEFRYRSRFSPHRKLNNAYTEREKLKALRLANIWQDNHNSFHLNERTNRRAAAEFTWEKNHHVPLFHDRSAMEEEPYRNFTHHLPSYTDSLRCQWNRPHRNKYSRRPFSAEISNSRYQYDRSLCCCTRELQCSAQLPPCCPSHDQGCCQIHSRIGSNGHWGSCPSSPQRYLDVEFPGYNHGARLDDRIYRAHAVKTSVKGKPHLAQRHLRPIAGAAPFATCPRCLKQLQLPEDFLHSNRKCHWLRCGSCLKVLKYSLVERIHLVPDSPTAKALPPSEVDNYSDAAERRIKPSTSSATEYPVSCSDHCGLSFCLSCSTDRDPTLKSSFNDVRANAVDKNASYDSSAFSGKGKSPVVTEAQIRHKHPVESYKSSGLFSGAFQSKKVSSEIEELPKKGSSPLHRLMGYSSARDLIYTITRSGSRRKSLDHPKRN